MKIIYTNFKWFLVLLLTLHVSNASAQWKIGVQAGYTNNNLSMSSKYDYDRDYNSSSGFTVGVPVQYAFFEWLAVQADLSYVQKNYNVDRTGYYKKYYTSVKNGYLQLPIYAQFSFGGEKLKGFLNAGAYVGYWTASRIIGDQVQYSYTSIDDQSDIIYYFDERVPFDSRRDNRFEAGLMVGLGLKYQITNRVEVFADGRYYRGLTDMQKKYMLNQISRYNDTFTVQVGCMFTIGKLK